MESKVWSGKKMVDVAVALNDGSHLLITGYKKG